MAPTFFKTPATLRRWLEANHATRAELWIGFYKRAVAWWIQSAKKAKTRERRLATLIDCSARGRLVPPFIPRPLN